MESTTDISPRTLARIAGALYLVNIVTAPVAFSGKSPFAILCSLIATASYVAVTVLLYVLFKPVNRGLSAVAALFGLLGCALGVFGKQLHIHIHSLVFFGVYCVLIGYLILRSTFLPRTIGFLMILAGLGWLTYLSPPLAKSLTPYPYITGGLGEGLLTLWLLIMGVSAPRWIEQMRKCSA